MVSFLSWKWHRIDRPWCHRRHQNRILRSRAANWSTTVNSAILTQRPSLSTVRQTPWSQIMSRSRVHLQTTGWVIFLLTYTLCVQYTKLWYSRNSFITHLAVCRIWYVISEICCIQCHRMLHTWP